MVVMYFDDFTKAFDNSSTVRKALHPTLNKTPQIGLEMVFTGITAYKSSN